jgi:hypothetical protein
MAKHEQDLIVIKFVPCGEQHVGEAAKLTPIKRWIGPKVIAHTGRCLNRSTAGPLPDRLERINS